MSTRSAWDTQPGTSETGTTSTDPSTTDPTTPDATEGMGAYTDSSTTRATRELAYAFHLFDGFERGNAWAVESAADHTVLALSTENVSAGSRSLKATFEACGKGNFEMRREVHLDLSQATTMLLDVYNATGAMDLVIGFRAGLDTTLFLSLIHI